MNVQKFTKKSLEAIQTAQNIAIENQNAQIEEEHLTLALLEQESSLIKELLKKIEISPNFEEELKSTALVPLGNKINFVSLLVVTSKASYFTDRVPSILHRLKFRQSLPYFFVLYLFISILNII